MQLAQAQDGSTILIYSINTISHAWKYTMHDWGEIIIWSINEIQSGHASLYNHTILKY